jgi:hypothetical protein
VRILHTGPAGVAGRAARGQPPGGWRAAGPAPGGNPGQPLYALARPCLTEPGYRYWPVLATVSIDRPASVPCLPETSVRM